MTPSRGPDTVVTFKEMSRVLAGFPDGRADEGGRAGVATLAGLTIAHEHNWTAAPYGDEPAASERTTARTTTSSDATKGKAK